MKPLALAARAVLLSLALLALLPSHDGRAAPPERPSSARQIDVSARQYLCFSLGRLLELQGLLADALVQYRRADALEPGHCEVETAIARVLDATGQSSEAEESLRHVLERCPESLEAVLLLGGVLLARGAPAAAEAVVSQEARPMSSPIELFSLLTQALAAQGRMDEALDLYRERAIADSLSPRLAFLYARALLSAGKPEDAVTELERAYRFDPENKAVLAMLGRILISLGRARDGVAYLERLTSGTDALEPEYIALASGYTELAEYDRAREVLTTAAAAFGETAGILRALGTVYWSEGSTKESLDAYERSLALEPDSVDALNFLAYSLADSSLELAKALEYATKAASLAPGNAPVRDTLGWTYYRLGRFEEALAELERAVGLGSKDAVIFEHLGDVYQALGRTEEASAAWSRALEIDPTRASSAERLKAISDEPGGRPEAPRGQHR